MWLLLLLLLVTLSAGSATAAGRFPTATRAVPVLVNGHRIQQQGYLLDGMTYVPLRVISETLGAQVGWDEATSTASVSLFPGNVEPYRSADKGVLFPLSIEQIQEAMVFGQANQKQDFEAVFGDYCSKFTDDWLQHYPYSSDPYHTCVLYTPWSSAAEYAYRMAQEGQPPVSAETLSTLPLTQELQFVAGIYCHDEAALQNYRAYIKQGSTILPAKPISVRSKDYVNDHAVRQLWFAVIDVAVDMHGLNLSRPLELLLLDPEGHTYSWTWSLYDLK